MANRITDETFALVARDIAQSAITAGFRDSMLMGDHGGGQGALKKAAADLDARYRANLSFAVQASEEG